MAAAASAALGGLADVEMWAAAEVSVVLAAPVAIGAEPARATVSPIAAAPV